MTRALYPSDKIAGLVLCAACSTFAVNMNTKKHPIAALFDLDGVIIDTETQYSAFWGAIGKKYLPELPRFSEAIKGSTLVDIFSNYFPDVERRQSVQKELAAFEACMDYPYLPGAVELVKALRSAGIPCAIVTSSDEAKMKCLYTAHPELPALFDAIFTAESVRRSKPAPDCYLHAAAHFGLEPSACFIFEDSISGLQAAQAAGGRVIALTTTNPYDRVLPYAHRVVQDLSELSVAELQAIA